MPDRCFSVLFLVQCTLVAACFLFHPCSLIFFSFILFLLGVASVWVFSFCLRGCLHALAAYGLSHGVVCDQVMVVQSQQFHNWNLTAACQ